MSHKYEHQHKTAFSFGKMFLSLPMQLVAVTALAGIVIYTLLFSTYPPVHDAVHDLRHSLMFIPCH
jgi:cobalt transporter subunit CbtB